MTRLRTTLAAAVLLVLAAPPASAFAENAKTDSAAKNDLATKLAQAAAAQPAKDGTSTLPGGASSLQEAYGDWSVQCAMPEGRRVCTFSQTQMNQQNRQRVLAIELHAADGGAAEGAVVMPFGLALPDGVTLQIDDAAPGAAIAYTTCLPAGCLVPLSFDAAMVAKLKTAKKLTLNAVAADTKAPIPLTISLNGFAPALARTQKLMQ